MKRSRTGLVVLIALLLVVAVGAIAYVDLRGHTPGSQCPGGEEALATLSGTMTAGSGSAPGQLSLRVLDSACASIEGVEISTISPYLSGVVTGTTFVSYGGGPVGATNPLPLGQTASGQLPVYGATVGERYTLTVEVSLASGGVPQELTLVLVAQSPTG